MQNSNVKDTYFQPKKSIRVGDKLLDLSTPKVMGILNITPDSFYDKSRVKTVKEVLSRAGKMLLEGADILDVGGYSTRPGADDISVEEEIKRVVPVITAIVEKYPETIISVDTFRGKVAEEAIKAGASIVNDISGLSLDSDLLGVVAKHNVPYILMHMRGTPQTMTSMNTYENLFPEIVEELSKKIKLLIDTGIHDIIIDPGFGFAKNIDQNHEVLRHLESFQLFDLPILVGISRKSMVYKKLGVSVEDSLNGTIALNAIAISKGANILRVHDVKEAVQLVKLLS